MPIPTIARVYPRQECTPASNLLPEALPVVRRRSTPRQGLAIQLLGNAVDHLLSSRMFLIDQPPTPADAETIHILMVLKRAIFSECEQVTESNRSLRDWMAGVLSKPTN